MRKNNEKKNEEAPCKVPGMMAIFERAMKHLMGRAADAAEHRPPACGRTDAKRGESHADGASRLRIRLSRLFGSAMPPFPALPGLPSLSNRRPAGIASNAEAGRTPVLSAWVRGLAGRALLWPLACLAVVCLAVLCAFALKAWAQQGGGGSPPEVYPVEIESVAVSGEDVTVCGTSDNVLYETHYAVFSAPHLASPNPEWVPEAWGVLEADGSFEATFAKRGDTRFYRVVATAEEFGAAGGMAYSVNAGGYSTVTLLANKRVHAAVQFDPLVERADAVFAELPNASSISYPDGSMASRGGKYAEWKFGDIPTPRGTAVYVQSLLDKDIIICGTLSEGYSEVEVIAGTPKLTCSPYPLAGSTEQMGIAKAISTYVGVWEDGDYQQFFCGGKNATWSPREPDIGYGEGFRLTYPTNLTWSQYLWIPEDGFAMEVNFDGVPPAPVAAYDPFVPDLDGYGVDKWWWRKHFGVDENGWDLFADLNGDRIPTLFAYFLGRDPAGQNAAPPSPTMIVDGNGANNPNAPVPVYTTLQAAYDAARQGEVVFVTGNATYEESLLFDADKSVLFVADTALGDYPPLIRGTVEISNTADGMDVVVMDGFEIEPPEGEAAVLASNGRFLLVNSVVRSSAEVATLQGEDASELRLTHCTLIETPVPFVVDRGTAGGCVSVMLDGDSSLFVRNSIFWDTGTQQEILAATPGNVFAADSTIRGAQYNMSGTDPDLTALGWLVPTSAARNAAETGLTPVDIHGNPRPCGIAADRGADEFTDSTGNGFPDWWEVMHFGAVGAASGQAHWNAYRDGTDPNDVPPPSVDDAIPPADKVKLGITSKNDEEIIYDNNAMVIGVTGKSAPITRDAEGNVTTFTKAN